MELNYTLNIKVKGMKMILQHGDLYKDKITGRVYELFQDYNLLWYLQYSENLKTLSIDKKQMMKYLNNCFESVRINDGGERG